MPEAPSISPIHSIITANHDLPKGFQWINAIGRLPRTMEISLKFYGLLEYRGADNNPTIINWAKEVRVDGYYKADSVAWCGLAMAIPVHRAGYKLPSNILSAKAWARYGVSVPLKDMRFGDMVILNRANNPSLGHVGRCIGIDGKGSVALLGGNQGDSFNISWFDMGRIHAVRRDPFKVGMPASMKKYTIQRTGALSINEA